MKTVLKLPFLIYLAIGKKYKKNAKPLTKNESNGQRTFIEDLRDCSES